MKGKLVVISVLIPMKVVIYVIGKCFSISINVNDSKQT